MTARARIAWAWFWVLACICVIWTLSSESFSGGATSQFFAPLFRWLFPEMSPREFWSAHYWVRKSAHLTEYAILAMLSFRALRLSLDVPVLRIVGLTLLLVVSVAGVDEFRQAHIATRTGSLRDVALNFVGGGLGVVLVVLVHRLFGVGAPAPREGA
jgi:VanZ family protein